MAKNNKNKSIAKTDSGHYIYNHGFLGVILAIIVIVLVWWKPAVLWAQITITISAALVLFHKLMKYKHY